MREALFWLVLLTLACAPVRVETRVEPGTDFAGIETYARDPTPHAATEMVGLNALLDEHLWSETVDALDAKGYRAAPLGSADMVVSFHVSAVWRTKRMTTGDSDANYSVDRKVIDVTVEIDVVDPRRGALVWHGVGEVEVSSASEVEAAAERAATETLGAFPAISRAARDGATRGDVDG